MTTLRLAMAGLLLAPLFPLAAAAQALDATFTPPTSLYAPGAVYALGPQQPDGQRLVAGNFMRINGTAVGQLVRLTATGALDQAFLQNVGPAASNVYRVQRFPNGQYLLAAYGGPVAAGGISRPELLRLNANGTADATFDVGVGPFAASNTGYSTSSAIQPDGKVIVAGYFDSFNNVPVGGLVRLNVNGSVDPTFSAGTGVDVAGAGINAVAVQADGKILVGGSFDFFNGQPASSLVRLNANGGLDNSFVPAIQNASLEGIVLQPDGKVVLHGSLMVNGSTVPLARLTAAGSVDPSFATNMLTNGYVSTGLDPAVVLQPDGKLLVAGGFNAGTSTAFTDLARLNTNGTLDTSFSNSFGPTGPNAIGVEADGSIVVGGAFNTFNGSENPLQRFSSSGAPDPTFAPTIQVRGSVLAVVRQPDGKLLIGGNFTELNGQVVHRLARLDDTGAPDVAYAAATGLLAGPVTHLALQADGKVLAGTSAGLFRFLATGGPDAGFNAPSVSATTALALQPDSRILWGCGLTSPNFRYLLRLTSTGAYDPSFSRPLTSAGPGVPSQVNNIVVQPDGRIVVAGSFHTSIMEIPTVGRVVRYETSGALDISFNNMSAFTPYANPNVAFAPSKQVYSLALQPDGKILAGGNFAGVSGTAHACVARLLANGTVDPAFGTNASLTGGVYSVALQPNGRVLLGGTFTTSGTGGNRSNLARVLDNGQLDVSFTNSASPNSIVRALALQPNGAIVLAGSFTTVGGQPAIGIVRIAAPNVLPIAAPAAVAARTSAWPVPAHGLLHVAPDASAHPLALSLCDALGRTVRTQPIAGAAEQTLTLDGLPAGVYLLRVSYIAGTVTRRIAVQ